MKTEKYLPQMIEYLNMRYPLPPEKEWEGDYFYYPIKLVHHFRLTKNPLQVDFKLREELNTWEVSLRVGSRSFDNGDIGGSGKHWKVYLEEVFRYAIEFNHDLFKRSYKELQKCYERDRILKGGM